ncbi:hypothetical protein WA556_003609, partial [Blastocystis sp. ATCC 50177/Nand II]
MEDSHLAVPSVSFDKNTGFFAVFDGHGGDDISNYCSTNLMTHLEKRIEDIGSEFKPTTDTYRDVLTKGFISFDREMFDAHTMKGGSTAITGFITPTHYVISNLGDSRCVLSTNHQAVALSSDHKPNNEEEKQRIIKAGGIVFNGRVNGDLAVARAFGDFAYKQRADLPAEEQEVSCQPDVLVRERSQGDNYIVFACDGIWDVFPQPAELVAEMDRLLRSYETVEEAIKALLDECLERGSRDNMTLMLVLLNDPPLPDRAMIEEQKRLDEQKRLEKEQKDSEQEP